MNKNIFELNDLSNMKEERFGDSRIFYMDNFYKYPDLIRDHIMDTHCPVWKQDEGGGTTHNMKYFEDRRHELCYDELKNVFRSIINAIGDPNAVPLDETEFVTNMTKFYHDPYNNFQDNYWWPHRDAGWNGIVYFNDYPDGECGTNIYKRIYEDPNYDDIPEHLNAWVPKNHWKVIGKFKSKYNRFVCFEGDKFYHGMNITDKRYFGDKFSKNYRINQVFFFTDKNKRMQ